MTEELPKKVRGQLRWYERFAQDLRSLGVILLSFGIFALLLRRQESCSSPRLWRTGITPMFGAGIWLAGMFVETRAGRRE